MVNSSGVLAVAVLAFVFAADIGSLLRGDPSETPVSCPSRHHLVIMPFMVPHLRFCLIEDLLQFCTAWLCVSLVMQPLLAAVQCQYENRPCMLVVGKCRSGTVRSCRTCITYPDDLSPEPAGAGKRGCGGTCSGWHQPWRACAHQLLWQLILPGGVCACSTGPGTALPRYRSRPQQLSACQAQGLP